MDWIAVGSVKIIVVSITHPKSSEMTSECSPASIEYILLEFVPLFQLKLIGG